MVKGGEDVVAQDGELGGGVHVHAGVGGGLVEGLVLEGEVVVGDAGGLVGLEIFDEVVGEGCVVGGEEGAGVHGVGGLHPAGREPGAG